MTTRPAAILRLLMPALRFPAWLTRPALGFALRTTFSSFLALYIAFLANLDDPKWAAMTVWIVAQNSRGMSMSKGLYRMLGTTIGAAIAILLLALFSQTPELFFLALAFWLGLCTMTASALRNFQAYGAVLAGYTAAIIAMDAVGASEHVFDIATARLTYVYLGIIVEALVTALLAPGDPLGDLRKRLDAYLRQTAWVTAQALRGEALPQSIHRLFAAAIELDTAADYAAAATPDIRQKLGHVRAAVAAALSQLATVQSLARRLETPAESMPPLVIEATSLFDNAARGTPKISKAITVFRTRLEQEERLGQEENALLTKEAGFVPNQPTLPVIDGLKALFRYQHEALMRHALLDKDDPPLSRLKFSFHIDLFAAFVNGARAFIAIVLAAAFWTYTAWPNGSGFVSIVGVVCALYATRPNPVAGSIGFFKGTLWAGAGAVICNFILLPHVSDYASLMLILGPFLIVAGIAMRNPATAAQASSFTTFFWDLINPENAIRMDGTSFFNGVVTLSGGVACGALVFGLLFPATPAKIRRRLLQATRQDLAKIARFPARFTLEQWQSRSADRISRLLGIGLSLPGAQFDQDAAGLISAMGIGIAIKKLHRLSSGMTAAKHPLQAIAGRLERSEPADLTKTLAQAGRHFYSSASNLDGSSRRRVLQMAALCEDIEIQVTTHAAFFRNLHSET